MRSNGRITRRVLTQSVSRIILFTGSDGAIKTRREEFKSGLNITRSLGDFETTGIIATPDITTLRINKNTIIVSGSDGILKDEVTNKNLKRLLDKDGNPDETKLAEFVRIQSLKVRDNATMFVLKCPPIDILRQHPIITVVCDGHGKYGHKVAQFLTTELVSYFSENLRLHSVCNDSDLTNGDTTSSNTKGSSDAEAGITHSISKVAPRNRSKRKVAPISNSSSRGQNLREDPLGLFSNRHASNTNSASNSDREESSSSHEERSGSDCC